jgi:hypothetical protein
MGCMMWGTRYLNGKWEEKTSKDFLKIMNSYKNVCVRGFLINGCLDDL